MRTFFSGKWQYRLPFLATGLRVQKIADSTQPHPFLLSAFACLKKLFPFSLIVFGCACQTPRAAFEPPSTAFFYGKPVPVHALSHYKRVVVEAENLPDPTELSAGGTTVFAYLSVGEAEGWRSSTRALDAKLFVGENAAWQSRVADLTQPGWSAFLIEQRMAPLWKQGYRAFFLDTLDSYQLAAKDPEAQAVQERALANIIRAMHKRFPGVQLLFNRGFTVLPEVGQLAAGVAAESLFQGWNATTRTYVTVSENDRNWLLARLREANERYNLPITVIDYVDPAKPELARETAKRIRALGFAPWVATPGLDTIVIEKTE